MDSQSFCPYCPNQTHTHTQSSETNCCHHTYTYSRCVTNMHQPNSRHLFGQVVVFFPPTQNVLEVAGEADWAQLLYQSRVIKKQKIYRERQSLKCDTFVIGEMMHKWSNLQTTFTSKLSWGFSHDKHKSRGGKLD